jgi:hypothetical protein
MSKTLTTTLSVAATGTKTNAATNESAAVPISKTISLVLASGTGDRAVDLLFSHRYTLTTTVAQSVNLTTDVDAVFGNALAMATVKAILIYNSSDSGQIVEIGGATQVPILDGTTPVLYLPPGGMFLLTAPLAASAFVVTDSTGDLITLTNSSTGTSTVDVYVWGTSA